MGLVKPRILHLSKGLLLVSFEQRLLESCLTEAEREVALLATRGMSNQDIAQARKSSVHTVANQLATAYRKLGLAGRRALRRKLAATSPAYGAEDGAIDWRSGAARSDIRESAVLAAPDDAFTRTNGARSSSLDAAECAELWQAFVAGRWSLVEQFERNRRQYFLVAENEPSKAKQRALSAMERKVFAHAELGWSNKLIGYTLGISQATVATHLSRARVKLGGAEGLAALASPDPALRGESNAESTQQLGE